MSNPPEETLTMNDDLLVELSEAQNVKAFREN